MTTPAAEMCTKPGAGTLGVRELPLQRCQPALPPENTDIEDKGVRDRETGWQKHKDATEHGAAERDGSAGAEGRVLLTGL